MKMNRAMKQFCAWYNMMERCHNPCHLSYGSYGGRGIYVHPDWHDFKTFRDDINGHIGRWPGPGFSLDRIDNDGPYAYGNVRWATAKEQAINRRPIRESWLR